MKQKEWIRLVESSIVATLIVQQKTMQQGHVFGGEHIES